MTLAIGLGIFVSIFRYSNRKQQINICRAMIVLTFVLIITLLNGASKVVNSGTAENIITGYAVLFPSISVVLTALAARAIKKDEELVRSADRIR
jgi:peptidoglycan/LPS O-acetylase OafA/YrhL